MTLRALLVGLAARFFSLAVLAQQPIVIKFSHVVATDTPKGKGAEFFKAKAEELTKGRVRVEVYPNSTLYKDKEEMEALQLGAVQMLAPSLAKFGPLGVKEFEVFDLPFIFDSYDDLHKVTNGPIGRSLHEETRKQGDHGPVVTVCPLDTTGCPDQATFCPMVDADEDSVTDSQDSCPGSGHEATVIIGGCETGIENKALGKGCSMNDLIGQCMDGAGNRGKFASCITRLVRDWRREGLIPKGKQLSITQCAAQAKIK